LLLLLLLLLLSSSSLLLPLCIHSQAPVPNQPEEGERGSDRGSRHHQVRFVAGASTDRVPGASPVPARDRYHSYARQLGMKVMEEMVLIRFNIVLLPNLSLLILVNFTRLHFSDLFF
jgi:hypothetical protein